MGNGMTFCPSCGSRVAVDAKDCPTCGAMLGGRTRQPGEGDPRNVQEMGAMVQESVKKNVKQISKSAKKPGAMKFIVIGVVCAAVALIAIVAVAVALGNRSRTFSVKGAVHVDATGYDTLGKLEISVDHATIQELIADTKTNARESTLQQIAWSVEIRPSEKDHLSNGQKITLKVKINDTLMETSKLKLAEDSWEYQVEGLEEVKTVDPFEEVNVEFTGISPNMRAEINDRNNPYKNAMHFSLDKYDHLKIGDTVTVKAETYGDDETMIRQHGFRLSATEKTYTVEGGDRFVTVPDDLDETILSRMQRESLDLIEAYMANLWEGDKITWSEMKYEGCLVMTKKPDGWGDSDNRVWLIFSSVIEDSGEGRSEVSGAQTNYFPICFKNVVVYQDGTVDYDRKSNEVEGGYNGVIWTGGVNKGLRGFRDETTMMTDIIRKNTDNYTYELDEGLSRLF